MSKNKSENPEEFITLSCQTTDNPKADAPRHEVDSIADMFAMVNEENLDRFMVDLRMMFDANCTGRKLLTAIASGFGDLDAANKCAVNITRFTWIDDHQAPPVKQDLHRWRSLETEPPIWPENEDEYVEIYSPHYSFSHFLQHDFSKIVDLISEPREDYHEGLMWRPISTPTTNKSNE